MQVKQVHRLVKQSSRVLTVMKHSPVGLTRLERGHCVGTAGDSCRRLLQATPATIWTEFLFRYGGEERWSYQYLSVKTACVSVIIFSPVPEATHTLLKTVQTELSTSQRKPHRVLLGPARSCSARQWKLTERFCTEGRRAAGNSSYKAEGNRPFNGVITLGVVMAVGGNISLQMLASKESAWTGAEPGDIVKVVWVIMKPSSLSNTDTTHKALIKSHHLLLLLKLFSTGQQLHPVTFSVIIIVVSGGNEVKRASRYNSSSQVTRLRWL